MKIFSHQATAYAELLSRAEAYFAGHWRSLKINTRWQSLLLGPTGSGKTTLATMLAEATGASLLRISVSAWMPAGANNRAVGETLPEVLRHVANHPKSVLFLDEIDKIYFENAWNSYVRGELFELLDGRWPVGLKTDDEDEEVAVLESQERRCAEKLRTTTFVLASGTFQEHYDSEGGATIGFHSSDDGPAVNGPSNDILARKLPRELTGRFNSSLVLLPQLTPEHYRVIAQEAEKSLPSWLVPAFRHAASVRMKQAIHARSGCRFIEESLVDALKTTPSPPEPTI